MFIKLSKITFLLLIIFHFGCRKDANPCGNKEIVYSGNHLIDISKIVSDKTITDSLKAYNLQVIEIYPLENGIEFVARPVYKNLVIFNNEYYMSKSIVNEVTQYRSLSWVDPAPPQNDLIPTITKSDAKSIAEKEYPELGCYTFQLGLMDMWDYDYTGKTPFILVYFFKSITSKAQIAVDAKTGRVVFKWDGVTTNVTQGF